VITCGLRGLALFDVIVIGPKGDLHSGLHGGVLRNPIQALTEICATLHTPDGRVNVPGFYDDVRDVESRCWAQMYFENPHASPAHGYRNSLPALEPATENGRTPHPSRSESFFRTASGCAPD
jgi:acetylornithine deacetylase/succinyl-diaminopimelate desuccinylase-like protein